MANLGTWNVTAQTHESLETLTGQTFTSGSTYTISVSAPVFIREGSDGEGFPVNPDKYVQFTAGNDTLYIKTLTEGATVNIAENASS